MRFHSRRFQRLLGSNKFFNIKDSDNKTLVALPVNKSPIITPVKSLQPVKIVEIKEDIKLVDESVEIGPIESDIPLMDMNSFEWFVKTNIDWVKEDPEDRYIGFVLSSNNRDQIVGYAEGALYYDHSIFTGSSEGGSGIKFGAWTEGLSGDGIHLLNTRTWTESQVCPTAGYSCDDDEWFCFGPDNHPFNPENADEIQVTISKKQKVTLKINGYSVSFVPQYEDGVLYGFSDGIYTLSFSKGFIPLPPK